jgi:hypothetical protein
MRKISKATHDQASPSASGRQYVTITSGPLNGATALAAPEFKIDSSLVEAGSHLRASPVVLSAAGFAAIVRGGALVNRGMPQFAELSDAQLDSLRHYVRAKARQSLREESAR